MKEITLKTIEQHDNVCLYSICFEGNKESEFENFMNTFKTNAKYNKDYNIILMALAKIIDKGALERFFRPEGKMNDGVVGMALDSRSLRLYCLRISDQILIIGNGGVKKTKTYNEDPKLLGYVMDLQKFEKALYEAQKKGVIRIEKNYIIDIESATFQI